MSEKYVYTVGGGHAYYEPFAKFGIYTDKHEILYGSKEEVANDVALVLFTGGADISPFLYAEPKNKRTYDHFERDAYETLMFHVALRHGLPMVGVCRGAQFLCAMAGGKLIQHVDSHGGNHMIKMWDGRSMRVSSTHHQMQLPPKDAKILAWADPSRSSTHLDGKDNEIMPEKEVEIAYYPNINALGMQHHPEMMSKHDEGWKIASELVEQFCF